jgi:hypothetical protein
MLNELNVGGLSDPFGSFNSDKFALHLFVALLTKVL